MADAHPQTTRDDIFGGKVRIVQHRHGYRYGMDALLLATDLPVEIAETNIADLGAAHGPVTLAVAAQFPNAHLHAVERQDALFTLLEQNVALNSFESRVRSIHADIRDFRQVLQAHSADLVLVNPPFFRDGDRRISENAERAEARHELHGGLPDFVRAACYVLRQRGWLKMVIPPLRLPDLFTAAADTDLGLHSLRFVHSRAEMPAYLVECVLRRGGAADFSVRPPLYVYESDGSEYTAEVRERLGGGDGEVGRNTQATESAHG